MKKALLALAFVFTASAALAASPTRGGAAAPGTYPFHPNDPDGDGVWDYNNGEGGAGSYQAGDLRFPVSAFEGVPTDGTFHPNDPDGDGVWDYNNGEGGAGSYQAGDLRNPPSAFGSAAPGTYLECALIPGKYVAIRSRIDWVRTNGTWTRVTTEFCDYTDVDYNGGN